MIKLKSIREGITIEKATRHSVGIDLYAAGNVEKYVIPVCGELRIPTGVCIEQYTPETYTEFLKVTPKSSVGDFSMDVKEGTVDADYPGEILVTVINRNPRTELIIPVGSKIAQLVALFSPHVAGCEIREDIRVGGFGSTDKNSKKKT